MIPIVVPHIDHAVTEWMDTNVRPHLNLPGQTSGHSVKPPIAVVKQQNDFKNNKRPVVGKIERAL
jgi:hypothetical protein